MQKSIGKSKIRPPCKIVTHKDFNLKLGTRDYVANITHHATLGSNRPSGGSPQIGAYNTFVTFCYTVLLSFSILRPCRTVSLILTLNGSNNVFPPKDGPFGGQDDGWRHMGKIFPKNSPNKAWIGSFKPKRLNLYIAISPKLLIWRTSDLRSQFRPRKALHGWSAITPKWIQHGWRPPCWKSLWRHISAADVPIWTKFGSCMQNNTPITAKW